MTSVAERQSVDASGTSVELRDVTVRVGQRVLLQRISARFQPGSIVLIVGCSGVGKSVLLKALAGLVDDDAEIHLQGDVLVDGQVRSPGQRSREVGVVFQNFALFDELSPAGNVRFAEAHRSRRSEPAETMQLLGELRVPRDVRTASLSGGQRQRLAIARTLAYDPNVILYDEPTSGLDVVTAGEVARLIQETHRAHRKTSILVTHDHEALRAIADQVFLVDARSRSLREIPPEQWAQLGELLVPAPAEPSAPPEPHRSAAMIAGGGRAAGDFLAATTRAAEQLALVPWRLLPLWRSPLWGARFLLHYLRLVAGPSAWLYIAMAGGIAGFVTTYFTFRFLPFASYTEPLLIEDLLDSMGFALYRILVPVLATILIAARCGAAVASDVGGKQYGHQMDALKTFGVRPGSYLLTNILYAFLLGTPLLLAIGYLVAAATSMVVFTATHADWGPDFWRLHFHRRLEIPGAYFFRGSYWLLAKTLLCAMGIALIAYQQGRRPKRSGRDVSSGITATILWSTLYVLVVHFVFAFYEF